MLIRPREGTEDLLGWCKTTWNFIEANSGNVSTSIVVFTVRGNNRGTSLTRYSRTYLSVDVNHSWKQKWKCLSWSSSRNTNHVLKRKCVRNGRLMRTGIDTLILLTFPFKAIGHPWLWIGVGLSNPHFKTSVKIYWGMDASSKVIHGFGIPAPTTTTCLLARHAETNQEKDR